MSDSPLEEHRFWLQIMGDHGRFIFSALSPAEKTDIQAAEAFKQAYDSLLEQARRMTSEQESGAIDRPAYELTLNFREFKLDLLRRTILGQVAISFTPTFLNHMVNELEEYLRILSALVEGKPVPQFDALHHDFLWLPDAAGHAASIAGDLDFMEKRMIKASQQFEMHFEQLYLKSIEMAGYMRTRLKDFPAFRRFHTEIDVEMKLFVAFLGELEAMELSAEALDRISPLMPDHMMREECYYLTKLARIGLVPAPDCRPDKPRMEA
ncbi:DUF2935 domain-containing protein [Cohnella sp. AR92]|uniref:DUF2935 domain-containing protein n=1 Tax=Cohnella sp. AR92 TaxID=648716 RepID=UPI000F8E50B4|nr:DUF2935 domain-containing protein [Cohnella sp. AR92]RUS47581.1 DUF2935 domain-containing protein [Cohnella sp. AR92]